MGDGSKAGVGVGGFLYLGLIAQAEVSIEVHHITSHHFIEHLSLSNLSRITDSVHYRLHRTRDSSNNYSTSSTITTAMAALHAAPRFAQIDRKLATNPTGLKAAATKINKKLHQNREVFINLHHHYASKVFNPGSTITGDLILTPTRDIADATIQISLIGKAKVESEDAQVRATTSHGFLNLDMPLEDDVYPPEGVFEAGKTYTVPFRFTIPYGLLPSACPHHAKIDTIGNHHMQLPPSMGDWDRDDMAPHIAKIKYAITASVFQSYPPKKIIEVSKTIQLLGSSLEEPPLNITNDDEIYTLRKSKTLRKGLLTRLGKITATATQASSFQLDPDACGASASEVTVGLFFEGAAGVPPPEVETVSAKIRAYTWYASKPVERLPNMGSSRGAFNTSVSVNSQVSDSTSWLSDSKGSSKPTNYAKSLQVQFALPASSKTFIPTFHSCLISRAYVMQLKVKVGGQSLALAVPVQVSTQTIDGKGDGFDVLPSFEESRRYA